MGDIRTISEIQKRNEKIFEQAVDKYSPLLWKIAASILTKAASVCEVEECVADVFIYLWEHPEKYNPEKGKLSTWLAMIARSKAIDRFRKSIKESELLLDESVIGENREELSADGYAIERLRDNIDRLRDEEREVIIRRFYFEQKNAEIAIAMGLKPRQVENRIYHAKQKLRRMMEEE